MLWIGLLALFHLLCAAAFAERVFRPVRVSDYPAAIMLTAISSFYGVPIILGYTTSFMNTWTIVSAAVITGCAAAASVMLCDRPAVRLVSCWCGVRSLSIGEWIGWAAVVLLLLLTLGMGSILPIRIWDAAAYHSMNPMSWAQSGKFRLHSFGDPALYPYLGAGEVYANVKAVLPFLVLQWTEKVDGTALAQWPFYCWLPALLLAIIRRAAVPRWTVPVASLFCMLTPEILLQSMEAYSDVVFLAAQLAIVWVCLALWSDGPGWRNIGLAALAFAQLAGSKPTGVAAGAALGSVFLVIVYARTSGNLHLRLARSAGAFSVVIITCTLVAGPWYLHGLFKLHNPVYPIQVSLIGKTIFPGPYPPGFNSEFATRYAKATGLHAWWRMAMDAWRPANIASWSGGMGLHSATLGLPAFAMFAASGLLRRPRAARIILLVCFMVLLASCPTRILGRFVLFEVAFAAIAFSWLLSYSSRLTRHALAGFAAVCMLYDLYATVPAFLYRVRPTQLVAYDLLTGDHHALRDDTFPDEYSALDYWREHVASHDRCLAIPEQMAPWFAYAPKARADIIRVADQKPGEPQGRWIERLFNTDATHVYTLCASENYRVAMAHPDIFHLLMRRVDSGAESNLWLEPKPEAALFELNRSAGRR